MPEFDSTVEYRSITDFPGYCVGNDGSVWSCRGQIGLGPGLGTRAVLTTKWRRLRPRRSGKTSHQLVTLRPGTSHRLVHRLVLEAFVGPCPPGLECCHDPDPNPANNHLSNLRWDTHKNNIADAVRQGRTARGDRNGRRLHPERTARGEQQGLAKLTAEKVREMRALHAQGVGAWRLAKMFGICRTSAFNVIRGRTWRHVE